MFNEIDSKQMKIFEKLSTKLALKAELKKINEEIDTLKVKEEIEEIDFSEEIESLSVRRQTLEEELQEEKDLTPDPKIIDARQKVQEIEERLRKLEGKKSSISETVYTRLKSEYVKQMTIIQESLDQEEKKIREYNKSSKAYLEKIDELQEELQVRHDVGDIPKKELNKKIKEIKIDKEKAKIVYTATQLLIDG